MTQILENINCLFDVILQHDHISVLIEHTDVSLIQILGCVLILVLIERVDELLMLDVGKIYEGLVYVNLNIWLDVKAFNR